MSVHAKKYSTEQLDQIRDLTKCLAPNLAKKDMVYFDLIINTTRNINDVEVGVTLHDGNEEVNYSVSDFFNNTLMEKLLFFAFHEHEIDPMTGRAKLREVPLVPVGWTNVEELDLENTKRKTNKANGHGFDRINYYWNRAQEIYGDFITV